VLGFLQELAAAARTGIDAARTSLAEQRAADAEQARVEREARAADLASQVAATPPTVTFAVALGAVYRETFLRELAVAAEQQRPPAYLFVCALPPDEVESVLKLLRHDFDVVDAASAAGVVADLSRRLGRDEDPALIARACWLVTAAAGAGLLDPDRVLELTEPFRERAGQTYGSWAEFGRSVLSAESAAPDSNALGRRALAKTVDALLTRPGSPWLDRPWPDGPGA
jgi:hypothetical protein